MDKPTYRSFDMELKNCCQVQVKQGLSYARFQIIYIDGKVKIQGISIQFEFKTNFIFKKLSNFNPFQISYVTAPIIILFIRFL